MLRAPPSRPFGGHPTTYVFFSKAGVTGLTLGHINGVKSNVKLRDDEHLAPTKSTEHVLLNRGAPFLQAAQPRDSGSLVWDDRGRAVGLIFASVKTANNNDVSILTYVTPIEDILADIKDFMGGQIVDIRIAQD